MATKKIYDLAVKTGEYEKDGQTKARYLNVGAIMQKEDGGKFIFLERTFNPAGVPNPDGRSNLILSMFKKEDGDSQEQPPAVTPQVVDNNPFSDSDDIPF